MRPAAMLLVGVYVAVVLATPGFPQTPMVVLSATVVDKSGNLMTDLPETAFQVFEDGVLQQIKFFKCEDVPVSIGLVIDTSASVLNQRLGAMALALVNGTNPQDEVFIVHFNDEPYLDKRLTNNIKDLQEGLVRTDYSGRAMLDAVHMSINYLKGNAKKDKKAIVVMTGGSDNRSIISLENLLKDSQDSGVPIYSVGLLSEEKSIEAKRCRKELEALAQATGGESFFPDEITSVGRVAHQMSHDIRNQYTIAYTPSNLALDGSLRRVKVTAQGPNGPSVRTSSSYNALVNTWLPGEVIRTTTATEHSESLPVESGQGGVSNGRHGSASDTGKPASLDDHSTLTDNDVIKMVQTGLSQDVIIKVIAESPTDFKFLPSDLAALGQAKVPEAVFKTMAAKQAGLLIPGTSVEAGGGATTFQGNGVEPKSASNVMSWDPIATKPRSTEASEQTRTNTDGQPMPMPPSAITTTPVPGGVHNVSTEAPAAQQPPAEPGPQLSTTPPSSVRGQPRVFMQSASHGNNWNARRDQSMEMSKDFERECPGVRITLNQQMADYTVALNHIEVGLFARDNQFQIADHNGDLLTNTKEGGSIKSGVKKACAQILADWLKKR